jgi:hypothetical protein
VRVGPSDGKSTAIVGGELAEGARVVVGLAGAQAPQAGAAGTPGGQRPRGRSFL